MRRIKKVLILSGPTHEYFDPVRFIGNASSGKMGKALAEEAISKGLKVEFISGPVPEANLPDKDRSPSDPRGAFGERALPNLKIQKITSAEEMLSTARAKFSEADLIIFAAAVADFQPLEKSDTKWNKGEPERSERGPANAGQRPEEAAKNISIDLKSTPDIAATLCANKRKDQIAIGFALQTHNGEEKAREKLISKNLDGIVLNTPATLGAESGLFTWIDFQTLENWGSLSKANCAKRIFDKIL